MASQPRLIKIGRQGILVRGARIPAAFFRHQQPGKPFVILAGGEQRRMHVRAEDLQAIWRAHREYALAQKERGRHGTVN